MFSLTLEDGILGKAPVELCQKSECTWTCRDIPVYGTRPKCIELFGPLAAENSATFSSYLQGNKKVETKIHN